MPRQRRLVGARTVEKDTPKLMITPMVDMFTVLLVFLLMSYGVTQIQIRQSDELTLPESTSRVQPELAVSIVISKSAIFIDSEKAVDLNDYAVAAKDRESADSYLIVPVAELLKVVAAKERARVEASERGAVFEGNVIIQGDRDMPFTLLRDVMFTAGQAEFSNFRFLVLKKKADVRT